MNPRWSRLLLAVLALVLTSCGLPTMREPAPLASGAVPARTAPTQPSGAFGTVAGRSSELFFVAAGDRLGAVRRAPVSGDLAVVIEQSLAMLAAGPDPAERTAGLSSAIPPGLTLKLVKLAGSQAIVDLGGSDPGPAADQAHLATGQVVLTLTALPGVDSVLLTRNGRPLEAALPDGELTALPLTRLDFVGLLR